MKKSFLLFLPFLLLVAGAFVSCEEVMEESKYDNWLPKNQAFVDSIKAATGENYVTVQNADAMEIGKLYALDARTQGSNLSPQYIYCKKIIANPTGSRPNYSGYNSIVSAYYYGTFITGEKFDGNFEGYSSLDQDIPIHPGKEPNDFNSPTSFSVRGVIPGWTWALQYMRKGERWILYIPWQSGYGTSDSGSIPANSVLTFDLILKDLLN